MASSSSLAGSSSRPMSSPLSRGSSRPMSSDVFKPKLPLDPFVQKPQPWALKLDSVLSATNAYGRRDVLLVLGAPSLRDLEPLLYSQNLAESLVILATHQPPDIPQDSTFPAVRILRLASALAIEDAGAVRFVNILECAERVARLWRKVGGSGIEEVSEAELDLGTGAGSLSPPNVFRFASSGSAPTSPHSSAEHLGQSDRPNTAPRSRLRAMSGIGFKSNGLPPIDHTQRPFDAVFNFLPANVSDKAILKQSILVTTISRPFLTSASNPTTRPATPRSSSRTSVIGTEDRRRWSNILNRNSMYSAPGTPNSNRSRTSFYSFNNSAAGSDTHVPAVPSIPRRAHLIHLVAPMRQPTIARAKLMQSMESFLCSFAYPTPLEIGQPDAAGMERAAPFLMHPYTLRAVVKYVPPGLSASETESLSSEWTITDLLLGGVLDWQSNTNEMQKTAPRAWIASANDITFVAGSRPASMRSVSLTQPQTTPSIRERQHDSTFAWGASGEALDLGLATPELTPPATPIAAAHMKYASAPTPMEKPTFRSPFPAAVVAKPLPTPPDSDESDSSGSMNNKSRVRPISIFGTLRSKGSLKQGKGTYPKWKFWKLSFATATAV